MAAMAASPVRDDVPDLWELARRNARTLRISTLITADQVAGMLKDDAGVRQAIGWCKDHGITHVYIESYRDTVEPPDEVLKRARDAFKAEGVLVSGCITTTQLGKRSTGWQGISCFTDPPTRKEVERVFRRAAAFFDEIMIDDFLFTDCTCDECVRARGDRTWAQYRCELMLDLSRKEILGAVRAVNPRCKVIIKYPCWHEDFQERGYDVIRETAEFDKIWVGTETRGGLPNSGWDAEPQYRAYWLMRWLGGIGGRKCGGGWYDWIGTTPEYYLEQARLTVLGGAREAMLFNFGALQRDPLGKRDIAAWRQELPLHLELAKMIAGRKPRGLLGWKPASSAPGRDRNLHCLLGMAGFPVIAAHTFDPSAAGFVFTEHTRSDPGWEKAWETALASGRSVVVSEAFASTKTAATAVVIPANTDPNRLTALAGMPQVELDALRDRATDSLGLRFHAPYGVCLFLFGRELAIIQNCLDEAADCTLEIKGWKSAEIALRMPADGAAALKGGAAMSVTVPARAMVVLRRASASK